MDQQSSNGIFKGGEVMKHSCECIICKEFDRTSKFLGICNMTGEMTGISNSCGHGKPDMKRIEAIATEAGKMYFENNIKPAKALKMAKEKYE